MGTRDRQTRVRKDIKLSLPLLSQHSKLYMRKSTTSEDGTRFTERLANKANTKAFTQKSRNDLPRVKSQKHPYDSGLPLSRGKTKAKLNCEPGNTDFRKLYYKREVTYGGPRGPTLVEGVRSFCPYTSLKRACTEVRNSVPNGGGSICYIILVKYFLIIMIEGSLFEHAILMICKLNH